jgi:hypothetical protein
VATNRNQMSSGLICRHFAIAYLIPFLEKNGSQADLNEIGF